MLLGADQLGRHLLGELPGTDAEAPGQVVTIVASIRPGRAFFENNVPGRARGRLFEQTKRVQRVDAVAPGAVITAESGLIAGHAFGTYVFTIVSTPSPTLAPPAVLGSVTGTVSRKAVVGGGLVVASSEVVGGRASGHASARGSVIEGVMPYVGDEDEMFMEEFA
jgi:hypothetical protein